jgi:hypothetical protein
MTDLLETQAGKVSRRLHNVWLHDLAGRLKQRRRTQAKHDGDDPNTVENYPISGDVTNIVHQRAAMLAPALMSAALMAGGAGSAIGVMSLMDKLQPPPAVAPVGPVDSEYEVRHYDSQGNEIWVPYAGTQPTDER